ncbi:MAG: hypothetical protein GY847_26500 [Proteobacteria bacterium]|nr:hypothetical protein [Pseudomonadota bacterium]
MIYPESQLEWGVWGEEYVDMEPGEVALTKEEFLEWCQDQDFDYEPQN